MEYLIKTPDQLGAVLKGFRRDRKLTQAATGARVGLAQNTLSEFETNPARSSVERLFKLLAALDLELAIRPRQPEAAPTSDW